MGSRLWLSPNAITFIGLHVGVSYGISFSAAYSLLKKVCNLNKNNGFLSVLTPFDSGTLHKRDTCLLKRLEGLKVLTRY